MLPAIVLLLITLPAAALSSSPKAREKNKKLEVERTQNLELEGTSRGAAAIGFMKQGDNRWILVRLKDVEPGKYNIVVSRGIESRVLGSFQYPQESTKNLTSEHPEFSNLYSGYWERFRAVRLNPPAPASPATQTPAETPVPPDTSPKEPTPSPDF